MLSCLSFSECLERPSQERRLRRAGLWATLYIEWSHSPCAPSISRSGEVGEGIRADAMIGRGFLCLGKWKLVTQTCPTLGNPMNCSMPDFPVYQHLPQLAQTHVHWVSDAIQPSHALSSPSPPAFNLSQHQGLFKWVSSSHQVAKVLEFQHQSFQWIFRTDFL